MHIVNDNSTFKQRAEEGDHGIYAFHASRERVMSGHRPTDIWVEELALDGSHIALIK
jgi:hypothetical protein